MHEGGVSRESHSSWEPFVPQEDAPEVTKSGWQSTETKWWNPAGWGARREVRAITSEDNTTTHIQVVSKNIFERMASKVSKALGFGSIGGTVTYEKSGPMKKEDLLDDKGNFDQTIVAQTIKSANDYQKTNLPEFKKKFFEEGAKLNQALLDVEHRSNSLSRAPVGDSLTFFIKGSDKPGGYTKSEFFASYGSQHTKLREELGDLLQKCKKAKGNDSQLKADLEDLNGRIDDFLKQENEGLDFIENVVRREQGEPTVQQARKMAMEEFFKAQRQAEDDQGEAGPSDSSQVPHASQTDAGPDPTSSKSPSASQKAQPVRRRGMKGKEKEDAGVQKEKEVQLVRKRKKQSARTPTPIQQEPPPIDQATTKKPLPPIKPLPPTPTPTPTSEPWKRGNAHDWLL